LSCQTLSSTCCSARTTKHLSSTVASGLLFIPLPYSSSGIEHWFYVKTYIRLPPTGSLTRQRRDLGPYTSAARTADCQPASRSWVAPPSQLSGSSTAATRPVLARPRNNRPALPLLPSHHSQRHPPSRPTPPSSLQRRLRRQTAPAGLLTCGRVR
jgi:hypothetical protein